MRLSDQSSSNPGPRPRRVLPRIGITMGDPAGIGPEVVLKAVAEEEIRRACIPVIIGDAQLLAHTARTLDLQSDRKSTRLNSSHGYISYAVFCLKKKKVHAFNTR